MILLTESVVIATGIVVVVIGAPKHTNNSSVRERDNLNV